MDATTTRIMKSLTAIEDNLDEPIALEDLADASGLSPYHFHRVFTAMTGEPVMTYIRRRRLTRAAQQLLETERRIIDIAMDAQFQSQQAFTRAFKQTFGHPPGVFRRRGLPNPILDRPRLSLDDLNRLTQGGLMEPTIITRTEPIDVIGFSDTFAHGDSASIGALWGKFAPHIHRLKAPDDPCTFGVCLETSDDLDRALTYLAGVAIPADKPTPPEMTRARIEPGTYAVFTHRGPISKIGESIRFIWGTWLPRSEYAPGEGPDFELYDERFKMDAEDSEVDIYVPVVASL